MSWAAALGPRVLTPLCLSCCDWDQASFLQFHGFGQSRSRLTVVSSFTVSKAVVLGPKSTVTHILNLNIISAKTVESFRGIKRPFGGVQLPWPPQPEDTGRPSPIYLTSSAPPALPSPLLDLTAGVRI